MPSSSVTGGSNKYRHSKDLLVQLLRSGVEIGLMFFMFVYRVWLQKIVEPQKGDNCVRM